MRMTSQQLTAPFQQATSERSAARQQVSTCKRQLDALNQQTMDMQKSADLQKARPLIQNQSLGGTPGQTELQTNTIVHVGPSQGYRLDYSDAPDEHGLLDKPPSSDADDENQSADPFHPPGLPPLGPPDDDGSDDADKGKKDKKKKKMDKKDKKQKSSRGRSRRRRRRDPSSSTFSSSSSSSSSPESSFSKKVKKALHKAQSSDRNAKESDMTLAPKFPQPENYRNYPELEN